MTGNHTGFLVPDNYVDDLPNETDMNIASIAWGLSLGITVFNIAKAVRQTQSSWERRKKITSYVALLWAEIISSFLLGIMCWFYLRGTIEPSMQFFFFISKFTSIPHISASTSTNLEQLSGGQRRSNVSSKSSSIESPY